MHGRGEAGGNEWPESRQAHAQRWRRACCGVLVLLAGLFVTGAAAQTIGTLVSNTGQQQNAGASVAVEAQSFTTGPHGTGYTLSSVRLRPFLDFTGDTGTFVTVKTDSAGRPGTLVAALGTPDDAYVAGNFFAYTAPAGTVLQAGTTYWIVLNDEQAETDWQAWGKTASSGEDSASLPGWSIGNSRLQRSGSSWTTAPADPVQLDIRGYKNADPKLGIADASAIEGNAVRFAVSLDNPTDGAVTVQYDTGDATASAGTDYTAVSSGTLTIPVGDTVAEISIDTTGDSVDEDDETFTVTLSSPSSNVDLGTGTSATGTILDDDGKAVVGVTGGTAVEGSDVSFTVSIRSATDADVTVEYSTSTGTGDTASASDFTAASGETATITAGQTETTVTIPTTQDSRDESDETFTLTISNPSSNAELGTAVSATGTIEDDDTAGLVLSAPSLEITEGASNSYTLALATRPSANVSVSIAAGGSAGLTLGTSQLTFTPTNWDQAQTVSVSADHDDDASPDTARLTHTAGGGGYGSVTAELPVAVTDDDTPAITLSQTALQVPENGSATFTVALSTLPTEKVTLELAGATGTDLTVTPDTIEFEPDAWDTPVTVTVEAAADLDAANDPETLTYTASGGDYEGSTASVAVEVTDSVSASIILDKTRLHVREGGSYGSYNVALNLQPASDVTVQVTARNSAPLFLGTTFLSGPSVTLTFTPDNWDEPQNVIVAGRDNGVTENREFKVRHRAAGGGYGNAAAVDLPVLVEEETARNGYVFSAPALSVAEGGAASYTLKLGKRPSRAVNVTIAGAGNGLTVEPDSLAFTRDNWNDTQTVTVTAASQVSAQDAAATLTHTGDRGGYDSGTLAPGELPVTIVRDVPGIESGGVALTSSPLHAADTYASGETIAVSVTFDRDVDVDTGGGSPGLEVDIGSAARTFGYAGMSGNRTLKFEYEVQASDLDSDGLSVGAGALALNGATIRASVGQRDADLGGTALSTQVGHRVDGGQALAAAKLASLGITHGTVSLDLTPQFDADKTAYDVTASGSGEFVTVSASAAEGGDATILPADADTNAEGHQVRLNGAETEITVTAVRAPRAARTYTLKVTQPRPSVSGVTVTSQPLHATDTYASGETIAVAVKFDQGVDVDTGSGSPGLEVDIGSSATSFGYAGKSGSDTLKFEHVVQAGNLDSDGISVGTDALALNGATIRASTDQRDADLGGTGLATQGGHQVDGGQALAAAKLASLGVTHGTATLDLTPQFDAETTAYDATTLGSDEFVTVSASAAEGGDANILPADADANAAGHQVRLDGAETEITVTAVRAPRAARTYTLKVTHARPAVSIAADVSTLAFHLQGLEFTVTRAAATAEALDVNLAFTQDQDFLPANRLSRTVTIPADQTSATLSFASSDFSGGATSDGTLTATISADPAYAFGTDASASVAMVAANPAIVVRPGSAEHVFREDSGTQTISIVAETAAGVPEPTDATFRILARTQNGTAVGGLDFGRILYSFVNFQASEFAAQDGRYVASKTLDVTIIDDALAEDSEDFSLQMIPNGFPDAVSLAKGDGSLCSSTCAWEIVIVDDDSPPAQVTGVVLTPGGGKLDVAWDEVVGAEGYKVQWKSGTETFSNAASDNREAVVSSGSTTSHAISGIADGTDYTVRVIATRDGLEGTPSAEATERPDLRTLTIADATATEGDALAFTVTLSPAASADVTVGYAATDGTATSDSGHADGADYAAPAADARLTIPAGQTTGTISVATGDDTVDEGDETFALTLADPSSNAVLGTPKTATGTIENDDVTAAEVSSISFTSLPSDGEYDLGDTIEVSVTFDAAVDVTGTPRVALSLDGTPAADSHALYDPGASSATVLVFRRTVTAADDDDTDGIGVAANALELNGGSIVNQGTTEAAVLDHAAVPNGANVDTRWIESIAVTSTPTVPATVTGDPVYGPGETVRFTVKFESAVTVDTGSGVPALKFSASDSGLQDAAYESGSGGTDLAFAWTVPADVPGDEGAIGVPGNVGADGTLLSSGGLVLNGGTIEDAGGRAVNVRHGSHATGSLVDTTGPALVAGAGGAVVDGNELVLAFERASGVPEHLDEGSEPAPGDFTVTVQGTARTATGVDVDGASVTVTLASAVGHAQPVTVGYAPGTDRLQDRWGNGVAGFTGRVARNDTAEPALSIANATAAEDAGKIAFTVTLDAVSGEAVTVDYATSDGTAKAGTDYAVASGTLEFAAGETSETVEVTLADDALAEGDETFKVTLSNASDASIAASEATGTIEDDEGTPTLTIADATATEGDALAFTVTLSPAASTDVTVGYAAADGTATSDSGHADGADYAAPAADARLTIPAGQTAATVSVATGDDSNHESDETFTLTLADPTSNAALGTPKAATGTIENDDAAAAEVSFIAFTSLPSDGEYDLGDTIEVSVTFDAAVDVTGTPRVALSLDGTPAADSHALHDPGASSATVLVFRRTVTAADDDDTDGIGVAANALELNGGSIVNQGTTEAAVLDHAAVPNGANVDTRWIESIAVTSTPTVPATVTGDPVYGPGETVRFTVKFESAVTVDTGSGVPALKFSASDSGLQDAAYESGSGGTDLAFAWTVPADVPGDEGAIGVPGNVGADGTLLSSGGLVLNGGTIEDAGGRAVNVRHGSHATGSLVDTTGPALVAGAGGAVVDGNELVLAFERASGVPEHLDEGSEPAPGDFTVTVQGTARTATGVDVDGASVTVTLASAVGHAQPVTVGYAPGTDRLQDRWGNGVAGFTGRVARNDTAEPALSIANATAAEDAGKIAFTVTLDAVSGEAVTVDYATSDGTAKAGTDYAVASGTLEFAAGETSETVEVTLADDALAEGDETFKVTLSNASDASIAASEATGTIEDDEGTPTLTIADATATEGDALAFTVTLSPAASTDVTVGYAAADGTATSDSGHADGADYAAPAADARLTIPAGQTAATVSVATGDDSNHESDETFTVTLADPSSNAALGTPKAATGTIENDDAAATDADLKALSVSVGGTQVSLTPAFAAGVLEYEADVQNTAASVTVSATENHRGATVAIAGDGDTSTPNTADLALAFGENTVTVTVTAQDGVTEKEYRVKVTRAAPVFEWAHTGINVGEDEGDVEIAVSLTPALTERVSVDYATEDGGTVSTPGEDYTPTSGTLTFEPGETRKTFTLSILDDTVYEPTNAGNVVLNLSNATAPATFGRNGTVLLVFVGPDNDSPATATMEDVSVGEDGGTMTFVMNLSHPVDGEVAYAATSARIGGTATESDDYGRFVSFGRASISIPAGQTSASLQVTIVDDRIDEDDETLAIGWRVSTGGLLVETEAVNVTGTIVDDDTRGVTVSETSLPVPEGGTATYTVVLDSQPAGDVTVTPSRSGGDADVTVSGALTFTPSDWDTAHTVTVSAAEDADAEGDAATVSHAVSGADYGSVAAADVAVRVADNDTASTEVRLSLSQDALAEGAGSTTITVRAALDAAPRTADTPVTVSVGAGGDGAVEGTDYGTVADFALTIDAGETTGTATFALAPVDDGLDEDGESLTIGGTTTASGLSVTGTTLTIEDDDTRGVTVSETALPVPEGGTATYTVVLDSQPAGDVTVTPSRSGGDADVTVSGALTFTPSDWDTAQTVTVSAAEDADAEGDAATVSHAVSGADYGSVTAADVAVAVADNDTASTEVRLSLSQDALAEGAGSTTITVTGTLDSAARTADTPVTVSVGAGGDGAVEGTDYGTVADFALTIDAGETTGTATFALAPVDDGLDEDGESLTIGGTTTASGLSVTGTTLTIEDDDTRGVTVSETALPVPEGGTATYTVVLDSQPAGDVTVTPSRSGGDADVTVSGALTFTPSDWDTAQTVTVSAAEDADAESDAATVSHAVSGADYGSVAAADVAVTVADNDTASTEVRLSLSQDALAEGAGSTTITVTGTLDGAPRTADTPVTVSVGAGGDGAVEGTDYGTVADFALRDRRIDRRRRDDGHGDVRAGAG